LPASVSSIGGRILPGHFGDFRPSKKVVWFGGFLPLIIASMSSSDLTLTLDL
jgi:hypothetical protein